jgi:hypothetical protein
VKFPDLFNRHNRRSLLIEINPYQILVAGVSRPSPDAPTEIECAAEFDADDDAGLQAWLADNFERQKNWVPAVCSFLPPGALLQRESIQPRKLTDPQYLGELAAEQYKLERPQNWKLYAINPLDGTPITPEGVLRPALIAGVSHTSVHRVQQRLLDHRLLPYRLELGLLPLFATLFAHHETQSDKRATVVVAIEQDHTAAYILGKEGVQTPLPVRHGFRSIVQAAARELDLKGADEVRVRLEDPDEELLLRASKFVRTIGRELKSVIDSYEMTTGQPVGEIYCAYLPPALAWLAEPLSQVVGRAAFKFDMTGWMTTANLISSEGVKPFGPHWLGALSLPAEYEGTKPVGMGEKGEAIAPWHVDCRLSAQLPTDGLVGRSFLVNSIAATVAACFFILALWLLFVTRSINADIGFWRQRIEDNRGTMAQIDRLNREISARTQKIDAAFALVGSKLRTSDFVTIIGKTRLPTMRVDNITASPASIVLRGGLDEPAEQASRSLRAYVDSLKTNPDLQGKFTNISLGSIQRPEGSDALTFEIVFTLEKAPQ